MLCGVALLIDLFGESLCVQVDPISQYRRILAELITADIAPIRPANHLPLAGHKLGLADLLDLPRRFDLEAVVLPQILCYRMHRFVQVSL